MVWLHLLFTHSDHSSAPVALHFHCPACGERNVWGEAWSEREVMRFLGLLQVLEERCSWVRGPCCERHLVSRIEPDTLAALDADTIQVQGLLIDRVSPASVALLVGAFLLFAAPGFGLGFLALAWFSNRSARPGFRLALRCALILHLVAMNALLLAVLISSRG